MQTEVAKLTEEIKIMGEELLKHKNDIKNLKKLRGELDDLKRRVPKKNTSKHKFRELCRENKCSDSFTYNDANYEKWKQSGAGSFFVMNHSDKPSASYSRHHDRRSDNSYYQSYDNQHAYYGN